MTDDSYDGEHVSWSKVKHLQFLQHRAFFCGTCYETGDPNCPCCKGADGHGCVCRPETDVDCPEPVLP